VDVGHVFGQFVDAVEVIGVDDGRYPRSTSSDVDRLVVGVSAIDDRCQLRSLVTMTVPACGPRRPQRSEHHGAGRQCGHCPAGAALSSALQATPSRWSTTHVRLKAQTGDRHGQPALNTTVFMVQ
jgi:hypothetical protein